MHLKVAFVLTALAAVAYGEVATQYKDLILEKHNEYRRKQRATNMNELVWSDKLAQEAERWASQCRFEHENKGRGENLAFKTNSDEVTSIETAFTDWYAEIKDYNYANKKCGMSCHYTQLVWSQTREVGCSIVECPSLSGMPFPIKDATYFACWYDPKGNWADQYPFIKGAACSECLDKQSCKNELCTGVGVEKCVDETEDCVMWEASGSCESNKPFMERKCRLSCGLCKGGKKPECKDKSAQCEIFKPTCENNKPWMKPNCMKTCGYC